MARRRRASKRKTAPDPVYESDVVARLVSAVMQRGKKSIAERMIYKSIDEVNGEGNVPDPLGVLTRALDNVKPRLEVKSRRVGGATYQVPVEVPQDRQIALAMRWIVQNAKKRRGIPFVKALAQEILDASRGQGTAIKKRDDVHRMAQANRAFAHLRW